MQELRCQRAAKSEQYVILARIDRKYRAASEDRHWRLRHQLRHGLARRLHRSDAATQPARRAGQGHLEAPERVCGRLHASGRICFSGGRLNAGKQPRQPCREEVRQQAKRSMTLRAVPPSNAHTQRRHASIAPMTCKRAAARRMQRTGGQTRNTPLAASDVCLGTRLRAQRDLQR